MSDDHGGRDPVDEAYGQAEALLSDERARAARRARVLAAVGDERAVAAAPARAPWRPAPWLAAAGVAGLSALLAIQVYLPSPAEKAAPVTQAEPAVPEVAAPGPAPRPAPATVAPSAAPVAPRPEPRTARPPQMAPSPAPAVASTEAATQGVEELVVTGQRVEPAAAPAAAERSTSARAQGGDRGGGRLRDAAAAGRTAEVATLLASGVPVDAVDDEGETALMKSIRAVQPAAAALLRRHGASLERENRAGESARDLARALDDPELNSALGLNR
jgi:hypothetical protein